MVTESIKQYSIYVSNQRKGVVQSKLSEDFDIEDPLLQNPDNLSSSSNDKENYETHISAKPVSLELNLKESEKHLNPSSIKQNLKTEEFNTAMQNKSSTHAFNSVVAGINHPITESLKVSGGIKSPVSHKIQKVDIIYEYLLNNNLF